MNYIIFLHLFIEHFLHGKIMKPVYYIKMLKNVKYKNVEI